MAVTGRTINFNVGVLGHIDSGKTALAKALSTTASTACFDKNPQSRERGITLDLGFSSFSVPIPQHMAQECKQKELQITLVDCPGHASLIRTIIGGAQIIDLMMLVVDITKGLQTQTAECLVLGEITCERMIIVLNKIDLVPIKDRDSIIAKMVKKLKKTLEKTKFANAAIIPVSAKPGGPENPEAVAAIGMNELVEELKSSAYLPTRSSSGHFIFAVDHCFSIRGQGTVMTGTVISGKVSIGDVVEIPSMKISKKVKSMQIFHVPMESAMQGDRVGICVTQFDPKLLERGLVCTPNALSTMHAAIISVIRIPYFKGNITTKSKFHISLGHETVMAKIHLFESQNGSQENEENFDFALEYKYTEELTGKTSEDNNDPSIPHSYYGLLEFERPVSSPDHSLIIGSRLDSDIHVNTCRLAFRGRLLRPFEEKNYADTTLPQLKVFKLKSKEGCVERVVNEYELIGRGLFKKETNISSFVGLKVTLSTGEMGVIDGSFGQSGKVKIRIPEGLKETTISALGGTKKKTKGKEAVDSGQSGGISVKITLKFKRYTHDTQKKIIQT